MNLKELLKGHKTYIIAGIVIIIVVCENMLGIDIPGIDTTANPGDYIASALGLGALRAGVSKT